MYLRVGILMVAALISTGCDATPADSSKIEQAQAQTPAEQPQTVNEETNVNDTKATLENTEKSQFSVPTYVSGKTTHGRCTQGTCEDFRWLGISATNKIERELVVQAKLKSSESTFDATFNCSYADPSIDWGDGQLEALPLVRYDGSDSSEDLAGASISSVTLYLSACHSDFTTGVPDGKEYGYKVVYPEDAE